MASSPVRLEPPGAVPTVSVARDFEAWDRFVDSAADCTVCHLAGWQTIMSDVLGHECRYLIASDAEGTIRGVMPVVRVRSVLGHYMVSLPFVNDGGPVGDEAARRSLAEYAVADSRRLGATVLELRARREVEGPVSSSYRKVAVHLPLPETVEGLWQQTFRAKLRSQIRRPAKEGMFARSGSDQLGAFYDVFSRNMRDLGTPVLPRGFFERLATVFGGRVLFVTVYTAGGVPAAAACCLLWRHEMEVTWASSLREYNRLAPNMMLYATLMEEAVKRGVRTFNFGRSSPGGSSHHFKQQWGGRDIPLPWAYWSSRGVSGTPSADNPTYRFATAAWRRLPMGVANRLGPVLARQLP